MGKEVMTIHKLHQTGKGEEILTALSRKMRQFEDPKLQLEWKTIFLRVG
jgi:hypothetical protein